MSIEPLTLCEKAVLSCDYGWFISKTGFFKL